jgi:hypothetical protein
MRTRVPKAHRRHLPQNNAIFAVNANETMGHGTHAEVSEADVFREGLRTHP